jgi:hypothetical protein
MTQSLLKIPPTVPFVDMKTAIQEVIKLGLRDYKKLGVIDWDVRVVKADPQGPAELPAIAISRTSDSETNQAIGDIFGYSGDPVSASLTRKHGTDFRETIELRIWTTNSDQRDLLYSMVKRILFDFRHFLTLKYGLVNQAIIGGRDEANHLQYESHFCYWGVVMFQAENAMQRNSLVSPLSRIVPEMRMTSASANVDTDGI